jgi:hypothetical protein
MFKSCPVVKEPSSSQSLKGPIYTDIEMKSLVLDNRWWMEDT